ncbi:MAG: hypothetical protein IJ867_01340 [Clostridia bacterium]|nr:hypothetical protein [Clostridia bacterium]
MNKVNKSMNVFDRDMLFVVVSAEISKAFIKYRKDNNLTQVQVAEILGVNQEIHSLESLKEIEKTVGSSEDDLKEM